MQALALDRVETRADDAFGGAAADIHHQPQVTILGRLRVGDAEVDQARLLAAGDDFDRMAQRALGRHQERLRFPEPAHGVGGDRAHALRRDVAHALAEACQTLECALTHFGRQAALAIEALGQAHGLAQTVDRAQLAEHVARHHHVETVGAQVDCREQIAVLQGQAGGVEEAIHARMILYPQIFANRHACAECGRVPASCTTRWYCPSGCSCQALTLSCR